MTLSKFQLYWRDLKENHPETYEKRLQKNAERIRKKRHAIYKNKELHEKFKAKNRAYYASRTIKTKKIKKSLKPKDTANIKKDE